MPRGNGVSYAYEDGTNRLTDTIRVDSAGIQYERHHLTLNLIGDKTAEEDQSCDGPSVVCGSWTTQRREGFSYDVHNRLASINHPVPVGSSVLYAYDGKGQLLSVQDENHTAPNTRYAYDELDRLSSVTQTLATAPGGVAITRYGYDVMDNLTSVTDPNGNTTTYAYDDFRRMVSQLSPVTGTTTYGYDPAGNLVSSTDARGATTSRSYDALNRLLSTTSTLGGSAETVGYAYDDPTPGNYGKGRVRSMTDPSGSTTYTYDRRGLLRLESKSILGDAYSTTYRYDGNGNRSGVTYPSGRQLSYGFDFADRPQTLSGTLGATTTQYVRSASYLPFGPEASIGVGAGTMSRTATYDQRYRIGGFTVTNGATTLAQYRYGTDAVGNITAISDLADPSYNRSFGYDDLNRLTGANTGSSLWGGGTYAYDALGNRTAATIGTKISSYAYQAVSGAVTSKLQSVVENGTARSVIYDAAGNEQQVGASTFVYSPRNYLDQGDGLHYVYDGSGVRVAQVGLSVGPLITQQPLSQPVCPGSPVTLSVTASGATTYQWQAFDGTNWNNISGATAATASVTATATTQYRVVVSNAAASTTSNAATITPIAVATEPASGILYGDVNHDGVVDGNDVALLRSALAGTATLAVPSAVADLNADGQIDAVDLSLLGAYAAHTIACLPDFIAVASANGLLQPAKSMSLTPNGPARHPELAEPRGRWLAGAAQRSEGPQNAQSMFVNPSSIARTDQTAPNPTQYFFYTPEKSLLSTTAIQAAGGQPPIAIDYIWFAGHPVAEERLAPAETRYTFTDHLGTPFLQTDSTGTPVWRVEYEPYGAAWKLRTGRNADQRLGFPGQEYDEETPEREYNIFRWYRAGWGQYTQPDPIGVGGSGIFMDGSFKRWVNPLLYMQGGRNQRQAVAAFSNGMNPYGYAADNPDSFIDPNGLETIACVVHRINKSPIGNKCAYAGLCFGTSTLTPYLAGGVVEIAHQLVPKQCEECSPVCSYHTEGNTISDPEAWECTPPMDILGHAKDPKPWF